MSACTSGRPPNQISVLHTSKHLAVFNFDDSDTEIQFTELINYRICLERNSDAYRTTIQPILARLKL
jgi:hypothetical protein